MNEPIDEVLRNLLPEGEQLTPEGKKEAMDVAKQVWIKAMEKTGGKEYAHVSNKTLYTTQGIAIYSGEKVEMQKPRNPKTDLIIMVSEEKRDENGNMVSTRVVDKYFFAPGEVTKITFDLSGTKDVNLGKLNINIGADSEGKFQDVHAGFQMSDPSLIRKQAERQINQRTEQAYNPNKADLTTLLQNVSSAKPR